jgi:HAD superfamily hydrolase (TIGR01662 family)
MLATSALIPAAASSYWLTGLLRSRRLLEDSARAPRPVPAGRLPEAVIFDRDGTLVHDVPYNGDPERVAPAPGTREALDRLRAAGIPVGVASNQSGVSRGLLTEAQLAAVNRRLEELVGPVGFWAVCPHAPEDGCSCRKPAPGLVLRAAAALGADPHRCVVVGDIGSDVEAAQAAGARGILVPTPATRPEEVRSAPEVVPDLRSAVDVILGESR